MSNAEVCLIYSCVSLDELFNYYWLPPDVPERQWEQGTRDFWDNGVE